MISSKSKLFFRFYCHIVIEKKPTFYLRTYKTDNRVLYLFQGMLNISVSDDTASDIEKCTTATNQHEYVQEPSTTVKVYIFFLF